TNASGRFVSTTSNAHWSAIPGKGAGNGRRLRHYPLAHRSALPAPAARPDRDRVGLSHRFREARRMVRLVPDGDAGRRLGHAALQAFTPLAPQGAAAGKVPRDG